MEDQGREIKRLKEELNKKVSIENNKNLKKNFQKENLQKENLLMRENTLLKEKIKNLEQKLILSSSSEIEKLQNAETTHREELAVFSQQIDQLKLEIDEKDDKIKEWEDWAENIENEKEKKITKGNYSKLVKQKDKEITNLTRKLNLSKAKIKKLEDELLVSKKSKPELANSTFSNFSHKKKKLNCLNKNLRRHVAGEQLQTEIDQNPQLNLNLVLWIKEQRGVIHEKVQKVQKEIFF